VGGNSLFDAIELRHDRALGNPLFIDFDGVGASKIAAAMGDDGWSGEFCIRSHRGWV
jgi:hypothetical protein